MVKKAKKKVAKKKAVKGEFIPKNSFIFVGNGDSDPNNIMTLGYVFQLNGSPVTVSEDAARRLRGNTHFKEI